MAGAAEDLDRAADVEALEPVEENDQHIALFHVSILGSGADGGNDGFPTFPAIRAVRCRAGPDSPLLDTTYQRVGNLLA
ncbi:hypothetical protein GCM10010211_14350 [Streptomyces albospinus]|uniref:Uncharacterized protein n=1 Tax=Streptomyces albospinus TaxID=285515 RepID=A0ABQ2UUK8_9ACTN|nr:hypothetical protein GCM10010211_14350 [Streptomyces albospinus]